MRKNYTYKAVTPATRNEFIDAIKNKTEAIVISHNLLVELNEELNKNISNKKKKGLLKTIGIGALLFFNLYNPLTWIVGIGSFLANGSMKNEIKEYIVYTGTDTCCKEILVLHNKKKIDLKYDTVLYDTSVKQVSTKATKGKIKL